MSIPSQLQDYLVSKICDYEICAGEPLASVEETAEAAGILLDSLVKVIMLKSDKAYLMAVIGANRVLDINKLNTLFKREFVTCTESEIEQFFPGCDPAYLPPLGEPFGLRAIVDNSLILQDDLYFASGTPGVFIHISGSEFALLQNESWTSHQIIEASSDVTEGDIRAMFKRRAQSVEELPVMPGIASEIIRVRNNHYAHASELAAVIEQDPSLTAQIMCFALSPQNSHKGKVNSVEEAIAKVLGMDFVIDVAFGLALGKSFKNPMEGPLGLKAFWNHAIHCASLTQALCNAIDYSCRPSASMSYLAGLLHNIGFLLLGHQFPEHFRRLNSAVLLQPERTVLDVEREELGVTHNELGHWLMEAWDMPAEIKEVVLHHNDPEYRGEYATYVNLVYIANSLLMSQGLGYETMTFPRSMLQRLGLDTAKLRQALHRVLDDSEGLHYMARQMAA